MMPLDQKDDLSLRYPGFRSFKTPISIHYRHRYCRIALILDTLDIRFSELQPSHFRSGEYETGIDCIYRRQTAAGWETVQIGPRKQENAKTGTSHTGLTREQIVAAPGAETARLIWAKRNTTVPLSTRLGVLNYLSRHDRSAELGALVQQLTNLGGHPDQLLAMFADGTLHIDVNSELTPSSQVRRRSRNPTATR